MQINNNYKYESIWFVWKFYFIKVSVSSKYLIFKQIRYFHTSIVYLHELVILTYVSEISIITQKLLWKDEYFYKVMLLNWIYFLTLHRINYLTSPSFTFLNLIASTSCFVCIKLSIMCQVRIEIVYYSTFIMAICLIFSTK